jgi:hypothetical protein
MAPAATDTITGWTFLKDARERISKVHKSYTAAEHLIEQGLQCRTLRRRSTLVTRNRKVFPTGSVIILPGRIPAGIHYVENAITYSDRVEYGVQLANEDLNKLPGITVSIDDSVDSLDKQKSRGRKLAVAMDHLKKQYPPDGIPPESVSTEQIHQDARFKLGTNAPGYDTFARARHQLTGK